MRRLYFLFISAIIFLGCESTVLNADFSGAPISISYSVPQHSFVILTLENSYNAIVDTLVNSERGPGVYTVTIDSYKYPKGVYYYTFIGIGENGIIYLEVTKKFIFIKR